MGGGRHREYGLADVLHHVVGQYRVAREHRANIQVAGYVLCGDHCYDSGVLAHGLQVHGQDAGMGLLAMADGGVQKPLWHGHVIDIAGLAADVLPGAEVGHR